jgi:hypothetical protein
MPQLGIAYQGALGLGLAIKHLHYYFAYQGKSLGLLNKASAQGCLPRYTRLRADNCATALCLWLPRTKLRIVYTSVLGLGLISMHLPHEVAYQGTILRLLTIVYYLQGLITWSRPELGVTRQCILGVGLIIVHLHPTKARAYARLPMILAHSHYEVAYQGKSLGSLSKMY